MHAPAIDTSNTAPSRTFGLLLAASTALLAAILWSTHHLLLVGAPAALRGIWPGMTCLLVPQASDLAPHLASYGFLLAIFGGFASGTRAVVLQQRRTVALVRACRAGRALPGRDVQGLASQLRLTGRVDVVDTPAPLAFCYGYLRPRVMLSRGLVDLLSAEELGALLIHEREHMQQHDPLKVAVGRLLTSAVFFVPLIRVLYQRYLIEKELAADAAAIVAQGSAAGLTSALAALLESASGMTPHGAVGGDEALDVRIDALLGEPIRLWTGLGYLPVLGSLAVTLLAFVPLIIGLPNGTAGATGPISASMCHLMG